MADLHAIDLLQVGLDVSDREAARVQRDDLLVKPLEASLAL